MCFDDQGSESSGNVCYFTMPGLDNDPTTEFFRILRIAFVRISEKSLSASADLPIAYPFTFRTFSPELLRSGSDVGEGTSAQTEPTCRMETMRETFARGLAYLKAAGDNLWILSFARGRIYLKSAEYMVRHVHYVTVTHVTESIMCMYSYMSLYVDVSPI